MLAALSVCVQSREEAMHGAQGLEGAGVPGKEVTSRPWPSLGPPAR